MSTVLHIALGLAYVFGFIAFGFFVDRADFAAVIGGFSLLFIGYAGWLFLAPKTSIRRLLLLSVAVRVALFFSPPGLSDDVYRFVWDGRLIVAGYNPMEFLPTEAIDLPEADAIGLTYELWLKLNSKDYYTVYPPMHQFFFVAAVAPFPDSEIGSIQTMRLLLLLVELCGLLALAALLKRINRSPWLVAFYALNPLVAIEGVGNLHFEPAVAAMLAVSAWAFLVQRRWSIWLSGLFFGLAVLVKLTPLILGPLLLAALPKRKWLAFFGAAAAVQLIGWSFFLTPETIEHFASSVDLYFRRFEFNASLYYLAREAGIAWYGYNAIALVGPLMSLVSFSAILVIALRFRLRRMRGSMPIFENAALLTWLAYLSCSTTVHPWYAILTLALAVSTRFRAGVLVWSFTVVWSYAHYRGGGFSEHYGLIAASYLVPMLVHIFLEWQEGNREAHFSS